MLPNTLAELLKLPADDRADLALALWDSLSDAERESQLVLTSADEAELDRRLADHLANPDTAASWEDVLGRLKGGR